jgi:hypothetical protein
MKRFLRGSPGIGLRLCLVVGVLALLSGCTLFRLLQFKAQLTHLDKHFVFEKSPGGPAIRGLKPILMPDDILLISNDTRPSSVSNDGGKTVWQYIQKKVYKDKHRTPEIGKDLRFTLEFNTKNHLERCYYPVQFSNLFSPEFVPYMLETMGNAQIEGTNLVAKEGKPIQEHWVPDQDRVIQALGEPYETLVSKNVTILAYRYEVEQTVRPTKPIQTWIQVQVQQGKVVVIKGNVFGGEMTLNLASVEPEKPRKK